VHLGDFELYLIVAGGWRNDGGATFGVVPKVLWERQKPADENNMIGSACNALVVRHGGKVFVCETGIGDKLSEKRAQQVRQWEPQGLLHGLRRLGVRPDEVDVVLTTHLHWDHAGGFTRRGADGGVELTFPRAKHYVQKKELDFALHPDPRSAAGGYVREDFVPVAEAGLLETVSGEAEVLPGVWLREVGGHTPGSQLLVFRAGEVAIALTGDLVGMTPHLRVTWTGGADLDVLRVIEEKTRLLEEASRHRWLLVLGHDTEQPAGYLDGDGGWTPEPQLSGQAPG
jgi:glyoxylase-like metal-dependent hydrolase (beta-lactamase superfamily II)